VKVFDSYYVEKMQLNEDLNQVQITWAMHAQPKQFVIPLERFKQIHNLSHDCEDKLKDHLPFSIYEAGFDDQKFESLYRTIYFQVNEDIFEQDNKQSEFMQLYHKENVLSSDQKERKKELDSFITKSKFFAPSELAKA